jgi:hypothetical protein
MVRGSNSGGTEIFRTRPDRPWGPPSLLYNGCHVSFQSIKQPRRGFDPQPNVATSWKSGAIPLLPSRLSWPVVGWAYLYLLFLWELPITNLNVRIVLASISRETANYLFFFTDHDWKVLYNVIVSSLLASVLEQLYWILYKSVKVDYVAGNYIGHAHDY